MKLRLLLLFLFFTAISSAQITDLNKLSRGRLYSYDEIKDVNTNIRGYFLLFESDKIAKETYELEYVVLDENLKKVTNGFITEMKYESWLIDADNIGVDVTLDRDRLLLEFTDQFEGGAGGYQRYRTLTINDNKLSDLFIFNKGKMVMNPKMDRKMSNYKDNASQTITAYEGVGMIVHSTMIDKKLGYNNRFLAHYDDGFNEVWRTVYYDPAKDTKKKRNIEYVKSDGDAIVMFNHYSKPNGTWLNEISAMFFGSQDGKLRGEYVFPNTEKFAYKIVDCKLSDDKIVLYGNYSEKPEYGFVRDRFNLGLFMFTFDKQSAKLTDSKYLKWADMKGKLPVNEDGYVKGEGYLFVHNMLPLENGKAIVVTEAFQQQPVTTNNMYFFELTSDFKIGEVLAVEKFRNKFSGTAAVASDIKRYGAFDFMNYQTMGDDEYLFYLNDNEKNSKNRKKSTLYGVVSYADGKFKRQTLDLKTEDSRIWPMNAKKGYLLLFERFDDKKKSPELRLEKINY